MPDGNMKSLGGSLCDPHHSISLEFGINLHSLRVKAFDNITPVLLMFPMINIIFHIKLPNQL